MTTATTPESWNTPKPRKPRHWPWLTAVAAAFAVGLLCGLAVTPTPSPDEPVAQPVAEEVAPSTGYTPPAYTPPTYSPPAAVEYTVAALGTDTFTYDDGLVVAVSAAQTYVPGRYAAGHDNAVAVMVTVTVTNNGSRALDPAQMQLGASYGGAVATRIFDSVNSLGSPPQAQVLSGKSISFPVAFSIVDGPGEFQVDVTPTWDHSPVTFVGPVG